jgi:predicted ribosome quality control (RQC) complex YloA/Tae2 family protein
MQTALHVLALLQELQREIVGGQIVSTEFYKKQRAAYIFVKCDKSVRALGFVYHPAGSGCFCIPASKVELDTREKPWPIFGLSDGEIIDATQFGLDRIFEVTIRHSGGIQRVVFEVIGPNGNMWLLDKAGGIQATLRHKEHAPGEKYSPNSIEGRLHPLEAQPQDLLDLMRTSTSPSVPMALKKALLGFNDTLAREAVVRAGLSSSSVDQLDMAAAYALAAEVSQIAGRFRQAEQGYLYEIKGAVEVYPFKLSAVQAEPEKFKTLSLAIAAMTSRRQSIVSQDDDQKKALQAVGRAVKRLERRVENVRADVTKASDYETYKRFGELLQLNREALKKGMEQITVDDVMADQSVAVTILLDPAQSPSDNIDAYFKKHRKARESLELLQRRLEISIEELKSLQTMQADLEADFESARERYQSELASLMPGERQKSEPAVRLPYKVATLSTGLTVFVGRDGADNDRTTFEFAKPYELWFHAQQCPGSHVVIKFPNKSFKPSKREIEEAASLAAWHSKARNNKLVPVVYAERRYVRKPRKAKPGLVTVEREKSVMVEPRPANGE